MAKKNVSYSERIKEVEDIVDFIETNSEDVDRVREKITRALFLLSECRKELQSTESEIQKLFDNPE